MRSFICKFISFVFLSSPFHDFGLKGYAGDSSFFQSDHKKHSKEIADSLMRLKAETIEDLLENGIPHKEIHQLKEREGGEGVAPAIYQK